MRALRSARSDRRPRSTCSLCGESTVYALAVVLRQKSASLEVPLCKGHIAARRRATARCLGALAACVLAVVLGAQMPGTLVGLVGFMLAPVLLLVGAIIGTVGRRTLSIKAIDDHHVRVANLPAPLVHCIFEAPP